MKIAIYGDSFASFEINTQSIEGFSWVDIVKQHYETVENFAVPGSSFYYSFVKFKEHHKSFDINIFLITQPDRLYSNVLEQHLGPGAYTTISSVLMAQQRNEKTHPKNYELIKDITSSVLNYYAYWKDYEVEKEFHLALLEKAKRMSTNTIFINCFNNSSDDIKDNEINLMDVSVMEKSSTGFIEKYSNRGIKYGYIKDDKFFTDYRKCHLSEENNIILGNKIVEAIKENRFEIPLVMSDFVKPSKDIDHYVIWRSVYDSSTYRNLI